MKTRRGRKPSRTIKPSKPQPSIFEILERFDTEEACIAHLERIRWPRGPRCLRCGGDRISKFKTHGKTGKPRHLYQCIPCSYQFSVTVETVFHNSHVSLKKWYLAIYLLCSAKKGISGKELQRQLKVTYKTAWYMAHRIRTAMDEGSDLMRRLAGDESDRGARSTRIPVVAIKERTEAGMGMRALESVSKTSLSQLVREAPEAGSVDMEELRTNYWLDSSDIAHGMGGGGGEASESDGGCENVWSLLKRGVVGVFHRVSVKYLPLYLSEFEFRFNNRRESNLMDRVLAASFERARQPECGTG